MKRYYSMGDLRFKLSSNRMIGNGNFGFGKFLSNLENFDYEIECIYYDDCQFKKYLEIFNKSKSQKGRSFIRYSFLKKDMTCVKKDFKKKKIEIVYCRKIINEEDLSFDINYKIIANLRFLNSQMIIAFNRIILHGSGFIRNGKAYIFLAIDEGGKTTLIKRNRNHRIINDDQIFYSIKNHQVFAYATPFGRVSDGPGSAPIAAFFYINKSKRFSIKKRDYKGLINSFWMDNYETFASLPKDLKKKAFKLISDISMSVPIFELHADHGNIDWDQVDEALKNT